MGRTVKLVFYAALLTVALLGCKTSDSKNEKPGTEPEQSRTNNDNIRNDRQPLSFGPDKLSEYGLFQGELARQEPAGNVIPYDINMPLFSDYAEKSRFVYVPDEEKILIRENGSLHFPLGTRLIKTFYYPSEHGKKLLETRILEKRKKGSEEEWSALTYIWNDEQTEAFLEVAGGNIDIEWRQSGQLKKVNYSVPNFNQCKTCHGREGKVLPLGPQLAQLNRNYSYAQGYANQLLVWQEKGILELNQSPDSLSAFPPWNERRQDVQMAARAYLDSNCRSCHHAEGSANTSGLFLGFETVEKERLGVMKKPVAAGKGSGGRLYSIVPGRPDESILLYRMESTDPGVMMPELGRSLVHEEGVELVRQWIKEWNSNPPGQ